MDAATAKQTGLDATEAYVFDSTLTVVAPYTAPGRDVNGSPAVVGVLAMDHAISYFFTATTDPATATITISDVIDYSKTWSDWRANCVTRDDGTPVIAFLGDGSPYPAYIVHNGLLEPTTPVNIEYCAT